MFFFSLHYLYLYCISFQHKCKYIFTGLKCKYNIFFKKINISNVYSTYFTARSAFTYSFIANPPF